MHTRIVCTLLALSAIPIAAQESALYRIVRVSVTDPLNRFVTGLEKENFQILENGVPRTITSFTNVDSPICLAIVSDTTLPIASLINQTGDEVIQTESLSDAVRQLAATKISRKALVIMSAPKAPQPIPAGIYVVRADPSTLQKTLVELRNQYVLHFDTAGPSTTFEVSLKQPRGLPPLKANWK